MMKFHHFGLLSSDPQSSRRILINLGYQVSEPVDDPLQNVRAFWATHPSMPAVEIITATDTPGPVTKLLKSMKQGVYHLCYEVSDLQSDLAQFGAHGRVMPVSAPRPAILFQNRLISFHFVENFGLVELMEPANPPGPS